MSLTTCPECGHEVSTTATTCPNCGFALHDRPAASDAGAERPARAEHPRTRRRVGVGTKILGLVVLLFIALAAAWYFGILRFV